MEQQTLYDITLALGDLLQAQNLVLGTAESCTGGLIAGALTEVSGSSAWFWGGVVSYDNSVKEHVLGVPSSVLKEFGAVSEETVLAMAQGVQKALGVDVGLSISGVAGPTGGTAEKPVGTVWMGFALEQGCFSRKFHFTGNRAEVRQQSVRNALHTLYLLLTTNEDDD